jgi:formamidopyrimidine-DNA glycosylase
MPELPEVETVRVGLEPKLVGRRLERVEIFDPRLTRPYDQREVAAELEGERVAAVGRRGKYLIVRFESGRALVIHLRMTGTLLHAGGGLGADDEDPYRRAVVRLDDGSDIAYRDVRRFGTWLLLEPGELEPYVDARVGAELLETRAAPDKLTARLANRTAPIKALLLDQRLFAGVGNIYADEGLWWARIHPLRPGGELAREEVAAVLRGVRRALRNGIARQGATLSDYRDAAGSPGRMQLEFRVYGRAGEPCFRCGTPIEKTRAGGRGTWYCPGCQR